MRGGLLGGVDFCVSGEEGREWGFWIVCDGGEEEILKEIEVAGWKGYGVRCDW